MQKNSGTVQDEDVNIFMTFNISYDNGITERCNAKKPHQQAGVITTRPDQFHANSKVATPTDGFSFEWAK
jgi:hypothetical protein